MSAGLAYLPLFGTDYLADTTHLTTEEHGAYLLLMLAAWRQDDCGLPLDDKKLARITGLSARRWGQIKDTILEFWQVRAGRIYQPRLLKEWDYACKKSESNRKSARARWDRQAFEKSTSAECDRISDRNAPQPQPYIEEPNGSSFPLPPADEPKPKQAKAKRQVGVDTPLPDDWQPNLGPAAQRIVAQWPPGMLEREAFAFRNHAVSKGRLARNWDGAFGTWIAKAEERRTTNAQPYHTGNHQPRDNRDGFERALDRRLERAAAQQPPRTHDARAGDGAGATLPLGLPGPGVSGW